MSDEGRGAQYSSLMTRSSEEVVHVRRGFFLARVRGVTVSCDWSCALAALLLTWYLATVLFPRLNPQWPAGLAWTLAGVGAAALFASVGAHEAAHVWAARAQGLPVRELTLYPFGAIPGPWERPRSPVAEFLAALVGSALSVGAGVACLLLAQIAAAATGDLPGSPYGVVGRFHPVPALLLWVGIANLGLGLLNLLPAYPLDGGRVVRAVVWAWTGRFGTAERSAYLGGQATAWLLALGGVVLLFGGRLPLVGAGGYAGAGLLLFGWVLGEAGREGSRRPHLRYLLEGVPVSRLMRPNPPVAQAGISVEGFVRGRVFSTDVDAFPVLDGGRLVGLVCLGDARAVPRDRWGTTTVREAMTPADRLVHAAPEEDAAAAVEKLLAADVGQLPVLRGDSVVGMLRREDVLRWLGQRSAAVVT